MPSSLPFLPADAIVWDNHSCMPLRPDDASFLDELARCRSASVNVLSINVGFGDDGVEKHVRMLAHFRRWIAQRPDAYLQVRSVEDIRTAKASGRLGIFFDVEGMNALGEQLSMVSLYYDLGVRWMLIAYNRANPAGGGCMDDEDGGLTAFGRDVIREMNRVGMLICCTHSGYRTAREAIDLSEQPVIFSHSNPRALWDHPRNIPDDLMQACAARGGVIGINGIGIFLGNNDSSIPTVARHVLHALDTVGEDHVAIGLDYVFDQEELAAFIESNPRLFPSGSYAPRMNMVAPWQIGELALELISAGVSETALVKILGGNLYRLACSVWTD